MNTSNLWIICLFGFVFLNQGLCRPQEPEPEYQDDGDGDGDYDDDADDYDGGPPPVMKSTSVDLVLDLNQNAILPCDVEGDPKFFSRIWRKDNTGLFVGNVRSIHDQRINLLPNGSLEILHVNGNDSGTYTCLISAAGKQEVVHTLNVKRPATITKITPSETDVSLKLAGTMTLECIAQGYPAPNIRWFKNNHALEDQDPSIHGARYTIDNASKDDSGYYKCTATNGQQRPDERVIKIEVHYPPQIRIPKQIVATGEGYQSEIICEVTPKEIEVKWSKDQRQLHPSPRIQMDHRGHDHILRILKTEPYDFGDYTCEAKNKEGESSAIIRLTGTPARPILETSQSEEGTKNPVLTYKVESFAPIEAYELLYKREDMDEWVSVKPAVTPSTEGNFFTLKHTFTDLKTGVYHAQLKAKNSHGWSELSDVHIFPKEHQGDLTETGLLAVAGVGQGGSGSSELRISVGLLVSLLVAHFYC